MSRLSRTTVGRAAQAAPPSPRRKVSWSLGAPVALTCMLLLAACPEIAVDPAEGPQGAEQMELHVAGTNTNFVQGQTQAEFSTPSGPSGIVVEEVLVDSPSAARVVITIPADEPLGAQTLTVTTGNEVAETSFRVTRRPEIRIDPESLEQGESGVVIEVRGTRTHFDSATFDVEVLIPGVQVASRSVVNDTRAQVVLDADLGASVGLHPGALRVYSDHQWLSADLEILPVTGRGITVFPDEGEQGQVVSVQVSGTRTDFLHGSAVRIEPPDDLDLVSVAAQGELMLSVVLGIHSNAAPGPRLLVVDDGYGELSATFTILEDPTPPSLVLDPAEGLPGASVTVDAFGTGTHFDAATPTTVSLDPPVAGVTATVLSVTSAEHATLRLDLDPAAGPGPVQVVLSTGLEHVAASFEVLPPPVVSLVPNGWYQRESVTVTVTGERTHFVSGNTQASVPASSGVTIASFEVTGPESAVLDLDIAEDAPIGPVPITFTDSWGLAADADFHVLPGRPGVELSPTGVAQGAEGALVTATGYFLTWGSASDLGLSVEPDCQPFLAVRDLAPSATDPAEVTFRVDVALLAPLRSCGLTFYYGTLHEAVTASLEILPGHDELLVGSVTTGYLDGSPTAPQLYSVQLGAGEVVRARVVRDPFTFIDPVLSLHEPGSGFGLPAPLAENDDESQATVSSRLVFRAQEPGWYFLRIRDRLGFNAGAFELHVHPHGPEQGLETVSSNEVLTEAGALSHRLVKGTIAAGGSDVTDFYAVDWPALGISADRVLVQVVSLAVSPFETSGADVGLQLFDPTGTAGPPLSAASWTPDPALYVDRGSLGFVALVSEGPEDTAYWLNIRPAVVINEVFHDEENAWAASFVELHGEAGADLGQCSLRALGADAGAPLAAPLFEVSLAGRAIGPAGYHVVGHDELVPGVTFEEAVPALAIDDPTGTYTTLAIVLECGGAALDALCYRGSALPVCEGTEAADTGPLGQSIGRGFHIDTDRNDVDFLPQVEPSPWERNYSEVW